MSEFTADILIVIFVLYFISYLLILKELSYKNALKNENIELDTLKSGFLLLIISSIIGGLLAMLTSSFPVGLLGIVVWYFILQIKKDGKSCWEQLS